MHKNNFFIYAQFALILIFSLGPLLIDFPFRIHVFLTWEGAYRISNGQIPFRDFGMPIGVGFWLIPSLFMKIFGPKFFSLLIAQSFINLIFLLALRDIFKRLGLDEVRLLFVLVLFCLSYIIKNFWPWYNNTVVFYQVLSFFFIIRYYHGTDLKRIIYIFFGSIFAVLAIFTKQDIGATAFLISATLFFYLFIVGKDWVGALYFLGFTVFAFVINIVPFLPYDFGYWFNYGQFPHYSRLSLFDFLTDILGQSLWIKFYLLAIILVILNRVQKDKNFFSDNEFMLFAIISLFTVGQTLFIQVTSYHPPTLTWYYHGFAIAFFLRFFPIEINFNKSYNWVTMLILISFWWSMFLWEYGGGYVKPYFKNATVNREVVSKYTRFTEKKDEELLHKKVRSSLSTLYKIKIPKDTEKGLKELIQQLKPFGKELHVLNFSELTFLEAELGYKPLVGDDHPLWNHVGVSFFEREYLNFEKRINESEFDMILFQMNDYVKDFFPNELKGVIESNQEYILFRTLVEPKGNSKGGIFIYLRSDMYEKVRNFQ